MARRGRKQTSSRGSSSPVLGWFITGLALGLGGAVVLFYTGIIPSMPNRPAAVAEPAPADSGDALLDDTSERRSSPEYEFFTVLPEMETVVTERELAQPEAASASPQDTATPTDTSEQMYLQVGSFRSAGDADEMKARLALLGNQAAIQTVTVDGVTWHRVRVGPVNGRRQAEEVRQQLQNNGLDVMVVRNRN
ncbi:hypothetical protein F3N42_11695 [Marinihelvus fidelis]|uniref:SPOR domain-containing protein n=1 Tax=Marinihelvus fidelis TaxID=2613842 RepID=A0A5N0T7I5_9GAMM|nr:SPOR domain-containing protein [Marinihelvus fidelis]KAA9131005.1 hypothetical protein F3N42_11695 [Marinihelvus fidelis]